MRGPRKTPLTAMGTKGACETDAVPRARRPGLSRCRRIERTRFGYRDSLTGRKESGGGRRISGAASGRSHLSDRCPLAARPRPASISGGRARRSRAPAREPASTSGRLRCARHHIREARQTLVAMGSYGRHLLSLGISSKITGDNSRCQSTSRRMPAGALCARSGRVPIQGEWGAARIEARK